MTGEDWGGRPRTGLARLKLSWRKRPGAGPHRQRCSGEDTELVRKAASLLRGAGLGGVEAENLENQAEEFWLFVASGKERRQG